MQNQADLEVISFTPENTELAVPDSPLILSQGTRSTFSRALSFYILAGQVWRQIHLGKILLFITSLLLFVLAVIIMKDGAGALAPFMQQTFVLNNAANCLGFGWLFAYVIMSGSPVAAAALTFFDAGVINTPGAFAMIIGSRLGASFIVLFIGFIYVLRGRDRATSLSMGLLSLLVTASTYAPAFFVGIYLLQSGLLEHVQFQSAVLITSVLDPVFGPITRFLAKLLPDWLLFVVGLAIIMLSFNLFDRCLPQMTLKQSQVGRVSRLVYRPWIMFILGAAITLISMSVSLSLSILVPLSTRGFVRRENVIPYILGANITTFIDTMLASMLLDTPLAFTVIFAAMLSITLVSIIILTFLYHYYQRAMLNLVNWVVISNRNLAWFMAVIFAVPLVLMWLS